MEQPEASQRIGLQVLCQRFAAPSRARAERVWPDRSNRQRYARLPEASRHYEHDVPDGCGIGEVEPLRMDLGAARAEFAREALGALGIFPVGHDDRHAGKREAPCDCAADVTAAGDQHPARGIGQLQSSRAAFALTARADSGGRWPAQRISVTRSVSMYSRSSRELAVAEHEQEVVFVAVDRAGRRAGLPSGPRRQRARPPR